MEIPLQTLRTQHLRTYGSTGLENPEVGLVAGCPMVYRAKYVDGTLPEVRSYELEYGSVVHDAFFLSEEEHLALLPDALDAAWGRAETPLGPKEYEEAVRDLTKYLDRGDDGLACVAVEQELTMPLLDYKGKQYFFGGRLDWLGVDPEDTSRVFARDYKTNRSPASKRDADDDPQFTGYTLLVKNNLHKLVPWLDPNEVEIVFLADYIKWGTVPTTREPWQLESYEDWLRAMCRRILDDEEGLPILNPSCSWCELKFDCPAFATLPGDGLTLADRMSKATTLEQRVRYMIEAKLTAKALKGAIDTVTAELKSTVEDGMTFDGVTYAMDDAQETQTDLPKLQEITGLDFYNLVNPVQKRIDEWVHHHPEQRSKVEATQEKVPKGKKLTTKKAEA